MNGEAPVDAERPGVDHGDVDSVDVVVVGAGAVGLACAAELARDHPAVVILERHPGIARETTSRNSEVIHAGLYYPPNSLKAELCVEGREALYQYCEERGVEHRALGKLVVATDADEASKLGALLENGRNCGAPDLALLGRSALREREPCVDAELALFSPRTGIVDAHGLCNSWLAEAESRGASLALGTELLAGETGPRGFRLRVGDSDGTTFELEAAAVVNAGGLESDRVAERFGIDLDAADYRLRPCKGDYFSLTAPERFSFAGLVYPVQGRAGLGVHVTLDLGGRVRFGPDTEYVEERDVFHVDPSKAGAFAEAVRRYVPGFDVDCLAPDYAGIRPKLAGPGEAFRDFVVQEESDRNCPGLVNLIGIESPGLTSAPAIARRVAAALRAL